MCPSTEFHGPLEHFFKACPWECKEGWKLLKNLAVWEEGRREFVLIVLSVYHLTLRIPLSPLPPSPCFSSPFFSPSLLLLLLLPFRFFPPSLLSPSLFSYIVYCVWLVGKFAVRLIRLKKVMLLQKKQSKKLLKVTPFRCKSLSYTQIHTVTHTFWAESYSLSHNFSSHACVETSFSPNPRQ